MSNIDQTLLNMFGLYSQVESQVNKNWILSLGTLYLKNYLLLIWWYFSFTSLPVIKKSNVEYIKKIQSWLNIPDKWNEKLRVLFFRFLIYFWIVPFVLNVLAHCFTLHRCNRVVVWIFVFQRTVERVRVISTHSVRNIALANKRLREITRDFIDVWIFVFSSRGRENKDLPGAG